MDASSSPDRGVAGLLRTRSRKADADTSSLATSDSDHSRLRASIDRGFDKLKDKTRNSVDDGRRGSNDSGPGGRLSKLVPSRSRRKKKNAAKDADNDSNSDYSNGQEPKLRVPGRNNSKLTLGSLNNSTDSFGRSKSAASSLLTVDSDPDIPATRPDLVSRASHKGYLTTSSPLIAAKTVDSVSAAPSPNPTSTTPQLGPVLLQSAGDEDPQKASASRGTSPLSKFRDAFSSSPKPSTTPTRSDPPLPEKANTFPRKAVPADNRPESAKSNKTPAVKVSTFPQDRPSTPSTYITPPTPTVPRTPSPPKVTPKSRLSLSSIPSPPTTAVPKDTISHRRVRSTTTSSTKGGLNPLTPHIEETKTPGGSLREASAGSGFFSSVFSATQNAVTQISASFAQQSATSGQRSRSGTSGSETTKGEGLSAGEEVILSNGTKITEAENQNSLKKEPAIATLGQGNLSLTHLGITDTNSTDMSTKTELASNGTRSRAATFDSSIQSEEASVAEAVSAAYSAEKSSEKSVPVVADTSSVGGRPRSIGSFAGNPPNDRTPPRSVIGEALDGGSLRRAGSVRSRLSAKRHRNSSAAGGAIGAALAASHAALANPASRRPTGFQVANGKRNKEFHQLFKSVPEDDHLIEDYSAALQRDILLQGRFYISEQHICFCSNILGWVTNLVIGFDEVVAMEKKSTAMIFPNAIVIQTLHAKNVFASFISRDPTYDLLVRIWRIGHPNLKTSENGHTLDEAKAGVAGSIGSDETDEGSEDDEDDSEYQDEDHSSLGRAPSMLESEAGDTARAVSKTTPSPGSPGRTTNGSPTKAEQGPAGGVAGVDFPGPATHAPTECADQDTHYEKMVLDTTVPAPLGQVYTMMFGPHSGQVMRKFLVDDQKSGDVQLEDDKKGMGEDVKSFSYSYIKPLGGSIGPKQTKCIVNQTLDAFDLEKAVSVTCSTQTPDVPSGNVFVTKTKYCLMWGPGNSTRILMNCTVEWSGKSWLKGPIEKGANDGQAAHGKDLAAFLKAQVAAKAPSKGPKGKVKGKKKRHNADAADESATPPAAPRSQGTSSSWGPLEPLHSIISPLGDIVGPLISPVGVLSILLVVMTTLWMRSSFSSPKANTAAFPGVPAAQRLAAYDQLWKREESQLWDWLEDRLHMDDIVGLSSGSKASAQRVMGSDDISDKLGEERMNQRQVDDAIKTTEERLQALKKVIDKKRMRSEGTK